MENVNENRTEELQEQATVEQPAKTTATAEEEVTKTEEATTTPEPETPAAEEAVAAPEPEETPAAEEAAATPAEDTPVEEPKEEEPTFQIPDTKEEIVARVTAIAQSGEVGSRQEQDLLKQAFYRLQKEERAQKQAEFVANGGAPADFTPEEDPLEEELKGQLGIIKEIRAKQIEYKEKLKESNLQKKKEIIEKIKALCTSPEDANKAYDTFRTLQAEWKEIKPIPESAANEIWKQFQFCQDQFYDLLKTNSAMRDYDFKKNLEAKTLLCEAAEKLVDDPDIIKASHELQQLHQEFREIGPVAKDIREELWTRFKTASSAINKRHAQYFEGLKEKEEENLAKKTAICEAIEAIETDNLQGFSQWDGLTKQIISLQEEWKTIGRAPKKSNTKIFERFRAACDNFFNKKSEFFKEQKKTYAANAAKKLALVEKAEELKESTQWVATTNEFVQLQKEWKEIGPTTHKVSNNLWERFNKACNEFFDKKKTTLGDQHKEESENLAKKKTIIEKLEALAIEGGDTVGDTVKQLQEEWNAIGHVPYKNKDKVYAKYKEVIDKLDKEFNLHIRRQPKQGRNDGERNTPTGNNLMRAYENKKAELATYENNISFLTSTSKKGSVLIDSMLKKIENLKAELTELADKINKQQAEQAAAAAEPEAKTAEPEAAE